MQVPPSCPIFGVVVIIEARRARNAEETERNRPAPPIFARREAAAEDCHAIARVQRATAGICVEMRATPWQASFAREVFTDARLSSKQREPARYRPRAPLGPRCPSGRVGLQNRPGGCESLRTCQFSRRLSRSSDGAWLKTTRARRKTASLHHFHSGKVEDPTGLIRHVVVGATPTPAPRCVAQLAEHRPVKPGK